MISHSFCINLTVSDILQTTLCILFWTSSDFLNEICAGTKPDYIWRIHASVSKILQLQTSFVLSRFFENHLIWTIIQPQKEIMLLLKPKIC